MGTLSTITGPTVEPVTTTEVKTALGVLHSDDDTRIDGLIKAARIFAEAYCSLRIMTQVVEWTLDNWPAGEFTLGVWPIQSVDSVKHFDTASPSVEQTLVANTDYYADTTTKNGRLRTEGGWPSVAVIPNPIKIRMTVGYADADSVPDGIKEGIKAYVVYLYDSDELMESIAKRLLWPERII